MKELIVAIVLISITALVFFFFRKSTKEERKPSEKVKKEEIKESIQQEKSVPIVHSNAVDLKEHLIKTFKDSKDLRRCYVFHNGHIILFSDDKRISLCYLRKLNDKTQKIISKSVDLDLISDISYSEKAKMIAVTLKNSKNILFYDLEEENGKNKLVKTEKQIPTKRKFEIKYVAITKDGSHVSTSGTDQDTEVQVYNTKTMKMVEKIETGGIYNLQMKMSPDDKDILISTFLNDISVIHFDKKDKFNDQTRTYEAVVSVSRQKSISGIKEKILCFEFSNDDRFFIVSCESKMVKILQNFGNISESKVFNEFKPDFKSEVSSLFVDSFFNGKIDGYIALVDERDIVICDAEGKEIKRLEKAHDDEIICLKLVKVDLSSESQETNENLKEISFEDPKDKDGSIALISASKDGRVKIWNLKLNK